MGIFDSYNFDWSYGGSPVGDAIGNYMTDNTGSDYSIVGDAINNYVTSDNNSSTLGSKLDLGKLLNTVGKLGTGIGTGIAALQNQQQPDYFLDTQWLGNGLAKSNLRSNKQEKQNMLDQIFGAGNMLGSLFGKGYSLFGRGNNGYQESFAPLPTNIGYDNVYTTNPYGDISKSINNYVRS